MPECKLRSPSHPCSTVLRSAFLLATFANLFAQTDPSVIASQASKAMQEERFAKAAELYGQLAASYPGEPSLQANLGMALHLSGQDTAAVLPLRSAASAMPSSFPAHFFLGASYSRLGDFAEAVEPLRQAVRLNPAHPFARALLGDALEAVGEYSEASDAWVRLRQQDGTNPFPYAGLVRCYEQLASEAIAGLQERDPESEHMLRLLAYTRLTAKQFPSALYLFREAMARGPRRRSDHEALAALYEQAGRRDWAQVERTRAASLPEADCSRSGSLECAFEAGQFDAIVPVSSNASSEEYYWAARAYAALSADAFHGLRRLPESADQLTLVADLLAAQSEFSEAAEAARAALAIRPQDGALERQMAELLYLARRIEEARPLLEKFRQSDTGDSRWAAMLGNLLAEAQDFENAIPLLESALEGPLPPLSARLDLGRSYLAVDEPAKAVEHLRAAASLDTDGSVHYQLSQAYQRTGMPDKAREALATYQALQARARQETQAAAALEITAP
ncbi:MAG: tetratricopeptide repeat protein [Acidobacteriia bacterium]|nr:tetratricopeptide repeat protein [Terriglobia bacterium]